MMIGEPPKQIGGSDPIPTFINHCFYGFFDPFSEFFDKFTEKIPMFEEGRRGQAGWAKFPSFTENLFL